MSRHAAYCRVSSQEQAERASIETQLDFLRRYFDLHNIVPTVFYCDDGVSGTIPVEQRPEGARMLAEAGKLWDTLHVYRLDRIGRDARIILNFVHTLDERGAACKSVTEPFDTSTPAGRFMLTILSGMAGMERDVIAERTADGMYRHAREGAWLGGPCAPFGYRLEGETRLKRLVPDEETLLGVPPRTPAQIVRELYRALVEEKVSSGELARRLNAAQVPTLFAHRTNNNAASSRPPAGYWRDGTVRQLLASPTYYGERVYGARSRKRRPVVIQQVPAIVDRTLWEQAQAQLCANQALAFRNAHHFYLLRGLLRCTLCGRVYRGSSRTKPNPARVYACGGKVKPTVPGELCPARSVRADLLEAEIWRRLTEELQDIPRVLAQAEALQRRDTTDDAQLERDRQAVRVALAAMGGQREEMYRLRRRGLMSEDSLVRQLGEIATEEAALHERLSALDSAAERAERCAAGIGRLTRDLQVWQERIRAAETPAERREVLEEWVEVIRTDGVAHHLILRLYR